MRRLADPGSLITILVAIGCPLLASCGGGSSMTPAAPSVVNVAGTWNGSMQYTATNKGSPTLFLKSFSMNLTQSGATVSGTWYSAATLPRTGTIAGTVTSSNFSGTFTYDHLMPDGFHGFLCTGTMAVSGPIGDNSLSWTSPGLEGHCPHLVSNITITAARQ